MNPNSRLPMQHQLQQRGSPPPSFLSAGAMPAMHARKGAPSTVSGYPPIGGPGGVGGAPGLYGMPPGVGGRPPMGMYGVPMPMGGGPPMGMPGGPHMGVPPQRQSRRSASIDMQHAHPVHSLKISDEHRSLMRALFYSLKPANGHLPGKVVLPAFTSSKLPKPILSAIWKLANPQKKPGLSENDFTVALRLIAIAQKGYPVNPKSLQTIHDLPLAVLGAPYSEHLQPKLVVPGARGRRLSTSSEISLGASPADLLTPRGGGGGGGGAASKQSKPPMLATQTSNASTVASSAPAAAAEPDEWALSDREREHYGNYFEKADQDGDGVVGGGEAVTFFQQSGLKTDQLKAVWRLADIDRDGKLTRNEFLVAFHLTRKLRSGVSLPASLPPSLRALGTGGNVEEEEPQNDAFDGLGITPSLTPSTSKGASHEGADGGGREATASDLLDFGSLPNPEASKPVADKSSSDPLDILQVSHNGSSSTLGSPMANNRSGGSASGSVPTSLVTTPVPKRAANDDDDMFAFMGSGTGSGAQSKRSTASQHFDSFAEAAQQVGDREEHDKLDRENKKARQEVASLRSSHKDATKAHSNIQDQLRSLRHERDELQSQKEDLESLLEDQEELNEESRREVHDLKRDNEKDRERLSECRETLRDLKAELESLEEERSKAVRDSQRAKDEVSSQKFTEESLRTQIENLKDQIEQQHELNSSQQMILENRQSQYEDLFRTKRELQQELQEQRQELRKLKRESDSVKAKLPGLRESIGIATEEKRRVAKELSELKKGSAASSRRSTPSTPSASAARSKATKPKKTKTVVVEEEDDGVAEGPSFFDEDAPDFDADFGATSPEPVHVEAPEEHAPRKKASTNGSAGSKSPKSKKTKKATTPPFDVTAPADTFDDAFGDDMGNSPFDFGDDEEDVPSPKTQPKVAKAASPSDEPSFGDEDEDGNNPFMDGFDDGDDPDLDWGSAEVGGDTPPAASAGDGDGFDADFGDEAGGAASDSHATPKADSSSVPAASSSSSASAAAKKKKRKKKKRDKSTGGSTTVAVETPTAAAAAKPAAAAEGAGKSEGATDEWGFADNGDDWANF